MNKDILLLINQKKYDVFQETKPEPVNNLPWKKELEDVVLTVENCPSCKKHSLILKGSDASCSGCKKDYFLVEKIKKIDDESQKKWMCLDCGHTANEIERPVIAKSEKCPSCNKPINFKLVSDLIENEAKNIISKTDKNVNDKSKKE